MYQSMESWEEEYSRLSSEVTSIEQYKGKLGESAELLAACLSSYFQQSREIEKLFSYVRLLSDQDLANTENTALKDKALNLYARFGQAASYISPELLSIDQKVMQDFLSEVCMLPYKRTILETLRYRPHTLSEPEERLLALGTEVFSSTGSIFSQLNNADLSFENVEHKGEQHTLSHSSYSILLKNSDRELRAKAFKQYYSEFDSHKNTLATTLASSIKKNVFFTRAKSYPSTLERALFSDNINKQVYENLISTVGDNLSSLHSYYELRAKRLKLSAARTYDTYVPIVPEKKVEIEYDQACEYILSSLAPLGSEYVDTLQNGLGAARWVDKFENQGKRSGAYSSGCYDSPPYILMSYRKESLNSMFTLTHEAGHSMHSYYSRLNQPYQDHSYTIFVAEVASTVNEILLNSYLRETLAEDPEMQAYLVNHQIDDIKATLHRQTMFAEFEKKTHEQADANEPLGLDFFRATYRELLEKYFGPAVSIEAIDELECFRIPHFYSAFYVYKYSTGISAAISLSKGIIAGDKNAIARYLTFLSAGCSKYSLELLADAGVDLNTPKPIEEALDFFGDRLKELKEILA
jgi:oligoendopeptidase F